MAEDPRPPDRELRRDIRRVTSILGDTVARTEGQELLDLVEHVRAHAKEGRLEELPDFDLATVTRLVRAFTAYFHLANITEQVHRGRALRRFRDEYGGWVEQAVGRIRDAGVPADEVAEIVRHVGLRPVFTAHPTEVARRSTIDKLRRVAGAAGGARQSAADPSPRGGR
ncbi:MAG: phosphoenolpyruvate carboxylase [Nocardioides sp.]